jgi:glutathione S-transferase
VSVPGRPVERARVRLFINALSTELFPPAGAVLRCGDSEAPHAFVAALAAFLELLPLATQFAVRGHFTIADAAHAAFLYCWELFFRYDVRKYAEGTGPRVYDEVFRGERFARL